MDTSQGKYRMAIKICRSNLLIFICSYLKSNLCHWMTNKRREGKQNNRSMWINWLTDFFITNLFWVLLISLLLLEFIKKFNYNLLTKFSKKNVVFLHAKRLHTNIYIIKHWISVWLQSPFTIGQKTTVLSWKNEKKSKQYFE